MKEFNLEDEIWKSGRRIFTYESDKLQGASKNENSLCEGEGDTSESEDVDKEKKMAIKKAMNLLLHRDRTEQELYERLIKAGFDPIHTACAIEYVRQYGYINDARYSENYIMFQKEKKSRMEIFLKLKDLGVDESIIDYAFSEMEEDMDDCEYANILSTAKKRLKGRQYSELELKEKNKMNNYFAGRGFSFGNIKRALSELE